MTNLCAAECRAGGVVSGAGRRVVMLSGGIGSWAAGALDAERHGIANTTLLFCDTRVEDADVYRFLEAGAADIGLPVTRIADGRTPWQVYRDERFLGNSSVDPCSKILKRKPADNWLKANCDPASTVVIVGIDWTEKHRFDDGEGRGLRPRRAKDGWTYEAPLIGPPWPMKADMLREARKRWLPLPASYAEGFPHANCGRICCKAGQGQFALLLQTDRARYLEGEAEEEGFREFIGSDVSMMTDRSGDGVKKPLTMRTFRQRIEAGAQYDLDSWGGCGCFVDDAEPAP